MQNAVRSKLGQKENRIKFKNFASLEDLRKLNTGNDKDVLILAVKYDLDELIYVDKTKKERINLHYTSHFDLLASRLKVITSGIDPTGISQDYYRKKLLGFLSQISTERKRVHRVINELSQKTSAGYTRLYNLEHSAVGVKYLAQVLKNYTGIVFNMINEVDTTNSVFHHFSNLNPDKIISPCENDTIRARYFLRKNLKMKGIKANEVTLDYIGPHNHEGFIPLETVRVDGRPLTKLMDPKVALSVIEEVRQKVNGFGEEVFLQKGSSDEDTVLGICGTLNSLFKNSKQVVRVSCYNKEHQLFSGFPGCFKNTKFIPLEHLLPVLSPESKDRFQKATNGQKLINQCIMSII